MAVPFERARELDGPLEALRIENIRHRTKELKGADIPHELKRGKTGDEVAAKLATILQDFNAHCWITAVHRRETDIGVEGSGPWAKSMARQLLLERVNGFLDIGHYDPDHWLLVWDISDVQELTDFSASVAKFRNEFSGKPRNERLIPVVLGGLSHDWGALQVADVLSNMALHYRGSQLGFADANHNKARAFTKHLKGCLQRSASGEIIGWKTRG